MPRLENEKRERFCQEFIGDLNGKQSAIRTGYSPRSAEVTASRLLSDAKVRARIQELMDCRSARTEITADRVLEQIARLGFSDVRDYYDDNGLIPIQKLGRDAAAALVSVKTVRRPSGEYDDDGNPIYEDVDEIKMVDKVKSLELLGKHLKLFVDRVEVDLSESLAERLANGKARKEANRG